MEYINLDSLLIVLKIIAIIMAVVVFRLFFELLYYQIREIIEVIKFLNNKN